MPLVTLDQACLAFGHVPLLDHADLVLDSGEGVALIGRNGSGKSSLLRTIAGVQPLDSGMIWRMAGLRVALVAQEPALDPGQTAFEAVGQGGGEVGGTMAGVQPLDSGMIWRVAGLGVALVAQDPALDPGQPVFEAVAQGAG